MTTSTIDVGDIAPRSSLSLLQRHGVAVTTETVAAVAAYRSRTHRSRWWGVICAVVAGCAGLLGTTDSALGLGVARILVGYVVGCAAAEMLAPRRHATGDVHGASLVPRKAVLLLPTWARWTPWVSLVPCLAAPALLLGDHPSGKVAVHDGSGRAMTHQYWFSPSAVVTVALTAAVGLIVWRVTLTSLTWRRMPVDQPDAARVDLLTRALSARAVSGIAAALGLALIGGICYLSSDPLHSMVCASPANCRYLYSWAPAWDELQNLGCLLLLGALFLIWFSRLTRVDPRMLDAVPGRAR